MPASTESTAKWKVDVSQLKSAMQEAKRSIQQANAEFKTATAGMDKWSKSSEGLEAKIEQLNKILPEQKKILANLEDQYKLVAKEQGENSKEAQDLKRKIEDQKAVVIKTETAIKNFGAQLDDAKKKEADTNSELGKLTQTISDQEDELKELKRQYENASIAYGENSDEAKDLGKQIESLSGELKDNKQKLSDAKTAADKFDTSIEETDQTTRDATEQGINPMNVALGNLVSQGINAAMYGIKNLAKACGDAWKEFDSGMDTIIAKTGATGETADALNEVYKNVSREVVGSFDELGTAVGEVNTRFGVSGKDLEDLSVKFLKFSKLNGTNVNSSIDKVQSTMAAWGITTNNAGTFLDLLNKAGQDTGVSVDQLADSLKNNVTTLQEMGLSAADSATFLANLDKNGLDTSGTLAGLKKALVNASKEGKPMSTALSEVQDSILNAKDSTEAITIATELFGSKTGAVMANAVRSGKVDFKTLGNSMGDFKGSVETTFDATQDAKDKFALALQGIKTDAAELTKNFLEKYGPQIEKGLEIAKEAVAKLFKVVEKFFDFIDKNGDAVLGVITGIVTAFLAFKTIMFISSIIGAIKTLFILIKGGTGIVAAFNAVLGMNPIVLVVAAIAGLIAAFAILWKKSDKFREFWIDLWDKIKTAALDVWENYLQPVFEVIGDFFKAAFEVIQEAWENILKPVFEKIGEIVMWLWENIISPYIGLVIDYFTALFETIRDAWENILKPVFEKIGEVVIWLWENVISPTVDRIKEGFKLLFEGIQVFWNEILKPTFEKIGEVFGFLWEKVLSPTIDTIKTGFENFFGAIKGFWEDTLKPAFEAIGDTFKSVWENVIVPTINTMRTGFENFTKFIKEIFGGMWEGIKKIINGILQGIETLANGVVNGMNKVIDAMNNLHFELPEWLGGYSVGFDLDHLKEISLPRLFKGGILERGQLGLLEGSGAEAVVPLEKNREWIAAVVREMMNQLNVQGVRGAVNGSLAIMQGGACGGSAMQKGDFIQNVTFNQTNNSPKPLNRLEVYRETNNLLFSAKVRLGNV